jgi:hypothetical protein
MTLEDLIEPYMINPGVFRATLGAYLPQTIELPGELRQYFGKTWLDSEHIKHEEIGGNLVWVVGEFGDEPVVAAENERRLVRSRSISDFRSGATQQPVLGANPDGVDWSWTARAAPRRIKDWTVVKPENITLGTKGNSVNIPTRADRVAVGDFHTHPSTPGGTNREKCGYQPPSLEDLMGMQMQETHGKDIFVSFVVVSPGDLYAMVYIRGVAHFDTKLVFEKIKLSLDTRSKRIKFPDDAAEEKYMANLAKDLLNPDHRNKLDKEVYLATNYGQRFALEIGDHLKQACDGCGIGLYHGALGAPLRRT